MRWRHGKNFWLSLEIPYIGSYCRWVEGILIGLVGAGIPLAIIYVVYNKAVTYVLERFSILTNLLAFLPVSEIYHILLPLSLGIGVGIGFLGSFITVRKHLRV